jgi:molybdenum cofactor biosynthesis protein B
MTVPEDDILPAGPVPVGIAVLTVSDTRTAATDTSGDYLSHSILEAGHQLVDRFLSIDDRYAIRAIVSKWIIDPAVQVILTTGGTGFSLRDTTPEAITPLFDREIKGFGEYFRSVSLAAVGVSTIQSRAVAGMANGVAIFALPGSTNACRTAWTEIICSQLDARHKPCNFIPHLKTVPVKASHDKAVSTNKANCPSREGSQVEAVET